MLRDAEEKIKALDKDIEETPSLTTDISETPQFKNRFVYQYDHNDLTTPINTFYSLRQAARSLNDPTYHDYHIKDACDHNTLFANYRWYYIDSDTRDPPETFPEIPPTVEIEEDSRKKRNRGLIAQLSPDKTQIIKVFANQRVAEKETKIPNCQISVAISAGTKCRGFHWMMYDDCTEQQKQTYTDPLPEAKRIMTCSRVVQRIDPTTNKVVETYTCMQDVCNLYKCCHKSINKASESGNIFKGFVWKIVSQTV